MSDLPAGWEWTTLGEIGDWLGGGTPSKSNPEYWRDGTIPWLSPKDMGPDVLSGTRDKISSSALENSAARLVAPNSVAIVVRSGILERTLPVATVPFATTLNQDMRAVVPFQGISPSWVAHFIRSTQSQILRECSKRGTTVASIDVSSLMKVRVPVAPEPEQHRIIATLEDHLSRLDAGMIALRSALNRVAIAIRSHTQALLEDLTPNRTLESILREPLRNGYSGRASETGNGVRTLTLTAVTKAEFVDSNTKIAVTKGRNIDDLWLEPGDILVQRSNTPELVGTSALYTGPHNWAIFPDLLIRVRPNDEALPEYVHLVLTSPAVRRVLKKSAKGLAGSMPKIDQGTLARTLIAIPPINDQKRIVQLASDFNTKIKRLQNELAVAQLRSESLRRSLLNEAFTGGLVPQDSNDEPASLLLERIRAKRTNQPKVKRALRAKNINQETLL